LSLFDAFACDGDTKAQSRGFAGPHRRDYGDREVAWSVQVAQLRQQLDDGTLLILYDTGDIRTTIVPTERVPDELKNDIDV
jgi:uncharacterized protein YheU (UPF0270 family)